MSETTRELKTKDFGDLFGIEIDDFPSDCRTLISQCNFKYRLFDRGERDELILSMLKLIDSPSDRPIDSNRRKNDWEERWSRILRSFIESNYDLDSLIPDFLRKNRPIRIGQYYGLPDDYDFELNLYSVFRRWFFRKYLSEVKVVYEFACGTAFNLVELAHLYPGKELHGLEWVKPPQEIIRLLAEKYDYNITGHVFDMTSPDMDFPIKPNSAILTVDGLEQLGANFDPFLEFILSKSLSLCVQVEPLDELYDPDNLIDYMALKFSHRRNYLTGYLTRLRQLETEGRIKIIKVHKMPCGLHHEGYSFVIWKPALH